MHLPAVSRSVAVPGCTWLYMVVHGWMCRYLVVTSCTWRYLVVPDCTWLYMYCTVYMVVHSWTWQYPPWCTLIRFRECFWCSNLEVEVGSPDASLLRAPLCSAHTGIVAISSCSNYIRFYFWPQRPIWLMWASPPHQENTRYTILSRLPCYVFCICLLI